MREFDRQATAEDWVRLAELEGEHFRLAARLDQMNRADLEAARIEDQLARVRVELLDGQFRGTGQAAELEVRNLAGKLSDYRSERFDVARKTVM